MHIDCYIIYIIYIESYISKSIYLAEKVAYDLLLLIFIFERAKINTPPPPYIAMYTRVHYTGGERQNKRSLATRYFSVLLFPV